MKLGLPLFKGQKRGTLLSHCGKLESPKLDIGILSFSSSRIISYQFQLTPVFIT